jgi:hypothetical protein
MTTNIHTDNALVAVAFLAGAREMAVEGFDEGEEGDKLAYAQVLALVGIGHALIAVADDIREAHAV